MASELALLLERANELRAFSNAAYDQYLKLEFAAEAAAEAAAQKARSAKAAKDAKKNLR